jgi:hypothetical protein
MVEVQLHEKDNHSHCSVGYSGYPHDGQVDGEHCMQSYPIDALTSASSMLLSADGPDRARSAEEVHQSQRDPRDSDVPDACGAAAGEKGIEVIQARAIAHYQYCSNLIDGNLQ